MTVLEAIEHKKTIDYKRVLLDAIKRSYRSIQNTIDSGNEDTKYRLDKQVEAAFEKATRKEIEEFTKTFLKNNGYEMEDPLNIEKPIEDLDREIDEFESEVDFTLSTSNSLTSIEVKI